MSTRCQIGFYPNEDTDLNKPEALLYRHSDGYPKGVVPDILPFLNFFQTERGIADIEYCSARLLQYLCNEYDGNSVKDMLEMQAMGLGKGIDTKVNVLTGTLGHGISKQFHWDIEYFYAITPTSLRVYKVVYTKAPEYKPSNPKKWKLLASYTLDGKAVYDEAVYKDNE